MKGSRIGKVLYLSLAVISILLLVFSSSCAPQRARTPSGTPSPAPAPTTPTTPTVPSAPTMEKPQQEVFQRAPSAPAAQQSAPSSSGTIGLAAGGAKDIDNFRENIQNNFLPLPTDITYEGLFYDYYFETGQPEETDKLFSPSYSYAVSADPFSGKTDYYLSVGLNSGMKESDFQRKRLNLVIVLDISGSMSSPFDTYYYDPSGKKNTLPFGESGKSKIRVATESIVALLGHLNDNDRVGLAVFNDDASVIKPLGLVRYADMPALRSEIIQLAAEGSTNMDAGMRAAVDMFDELKDSDPDYYENRIIYLTDAMPNQGDTSERGLLGMVKRNAANRIYTTFIGIGVDFNSELVNYITRQKGANYYSVHSSGDFRRRLDEEFDYMVTPLVFNLKLSLKAFGWEIEKVYGSPEASEATGELMKVNTLFPSKKVDDETKGGLILLKLRKTGPGGSLLLTASYEDRNGRPDISEAIVRLDGKAPEYFRDSGIRKGVLLARYADLLKDWMIDERQYVHITTPWQPMVDERHGIVLPPMHNNWERQSLALRVSGPYPRLFSQFSDYFEKEMDPLNDRTLEQELDILRQLSRGYSPRGDR